MFNRGVEIGRKRETMYHPGAENGVLRSDWLKTPRSCTEIIREDFKTICARAELAYRTDGLTKRVVNLIASFVVGQGIQPFPAVKKGNGDYVEGVNKQLSEDWERFNDQGIRAGTAHLTIYQAQFLKCLTMIVYGSVLQNQVKSKKGSLLPVAFQILKPTRLDFSKDNYWNTGYETDITSRIVHGIQLDKYGEALKYYFEGETQARDATNIDLSFIPIEADQYLGISWLTTALPAIYDRQQLLSNKLKQSRIGSNLGMQLPRNLQQGIEAVLDNDSDGNKYMDLDFQGFVFTDKDIKPISFVDPIATSFEPLMRMIVQEVAIANGISYQRLTTDLKDANFTSGRINTLLDTKIFRVLFKQFTDCSCQYDWNRFVEWEVFTGRLERHGIGYSQYLSDPWYYSQCYWLPKDEEDWVDPYKDAQALLLLYKMGKITYQEMCSKSGKGYKSIILQLKREKEELIDAGLDHLLPQNIDSKETVETKEKENKNANSVEE
ncbi:MAG: phage portal protein [Candidatus Paceibacterota bacterium]